MWLPSSTAADDAPNKFVILSEVAASRSEAAAQSKDTYISDPATTTQPTSRCSASFCCYNFQFAILARRGKPRLYYEVSSCRKLCSFRIPRQSPF